MHQHIVPPATHPSATKLLQKMAIQSQYIEVPSLTVEGTKPLDCFPNVDKVIAERGGSVVYGWQIWHTLPGAMIEAEFHAVWKDERGVLYNVTPYLLPGIERILFLPDPSRTYRGKQVDNIRLALNNDGLVKRFITVAKRLFKLTNEGELAYQYLLRPTPEIQQARRKYVALDKQVQAKYGKVD